MPWRFCLCEFQSQNIEPLIRPIDIVIHPSACLITDNCLACRQSPLLLWLKVWEGRFYIWEKQTNAAFVCSCLRLKVETLSVWDSFSRLRVQWHNSWSENVLRRTEITQPRHIPICLCYRPATATLSGVRPLLRSVPVCCARRAISHPNLDLQRKWKPQHSFTLHWLAALAELVC